MSVGVVLGRMETLCRYRPDEAVRLISFHAVVARALHRLALNGAHGGHSRRKSGGCSPNGPHFVIVLHSRHQVGGSTFVRARSEMSMKKAGSDPVVGMERHHPLWLPWDAILATLLFVVLLCVGSARL